MLSCADVQKILDASIPPEAIKPPLPGRGIFGEYVTGQWVVQEANTLLGFDSWDVRDVQTQVFNTADGDMIFVTTLWVILKYLDESNSVQSVSRPGRGVGIAYVRRERVGNEVKVMPPKPPEIDTACKASLTDAIKNAWMRFGRHFGGELYFDERMAQIVFADYSDDGGDEAHVEPTYVANDNSRRRQAPAAGDSRKRVKMWFGQEMVADEKPGGNRLVENQTFRSFVMTGLEMDSFSERHPRLLNHLKKHFGIDSLHDLTWEMLQALRTLCVEGVQKAEEQFPQYYGGERAVTQRTADHLRKTADDDSEDLVSVGGIQVPSRIVSLFRDLFPGDGWADRFLQIVGPMSTWSDNHTEIMEQLLRGARNTSIADINVLRQLWAAVVG